MTYHRFLQQIVIIAAFLIMPSGASLAADDRTEIDNAALQLIVAPRGEDGTIRAMLDLKMDPGFKSYWFMPGSGGLPPQVTPMSSHEVDLHLPVPERIEDAYGLALGYKKRLRIPLTLTGGGPSEPVKLDILLGVCADICIPFFATLQADVPILANFDPRSNFALQAAFDALPETADDTMYARTVSLQPHKSAKSKMQLRFEAIVPQDVEADDLRAFAAVRGNGDFFTGEERVERLENGRLQVTIPVTSALQASDFSGERLTLVLATPQRAVQQVLPLP